MLQHSVYKLKKLKESGVLISTRAYFDMKKIGFFGFLLLGLIVCSLSIATGVSAAESTAPEMILVPAGTFQMGSDDFYNAKPVHKVTLTNDFYIGKYEITNQQYADALNYAWSKGYLNKDELSQKAKRRRASAYFPPATACAARATAKSLLTAANADDRLQRISVLRK